MNVCITVVRGGDTKSDAEIEDLTKCSYRIRSIFCQSCCYRPTPPIEYARINWITAAVCSRIFDNTYRQFEARDFREFGSVVTVVTTDFEAMYAYKRGDYQRCLQLSTQNVHYTRCCMPRAWRLIVATLPEVIELLDNDTVSLTSLTLLVNPECTNCRNSRGISQLTLSLYLMTQCQLKLRGAWLTT